MAIPFFYSTELDQEFIDLNEDTSKHVIGVLRMTKNDEILLTNGLGKKATAVIVEDNRKKCRVQVRKLEENYKKENKVAIGISLIKNSSRFEWFLEKATEMGVSEIFPLICSRTEKEKFRLDRLQHILISAMLQSQQCWLPVLHEPVNFEKVCSIKDFQNKFIAHCLPEQRTSLREQSVQPGASQLILIGPEGDFTPAEISLALEKNFMPVMLGSTRLRTETAGMVAAALLCIH